MKRYPREDRWTPWKKIATQGKVRKFLNIKTHFRKKLGDAGLKDYGCALYYESYLKIKEVCVCMCVFVRSLLQVWDFFFFCWLYLRETIDYSYSCSPLPGNGLKFLVLSRAWAFDGPLRFLKSHLIKAKGTLITQESPNDSELRQDAGT